MAPLARDPVQAFVGLGANLGAAAQTVRDAMAALDHLPQTQVRRRSSLYRSAPQQASGPDYVNAVVELRTGLGAPQLLAALQVLEVAAGRERPYRNAPRTLDLDLLLYGEAQIFSLMLTVPHPRMTERAFVLVPLSEIAPQRVAVHWLDQTRDQTVNRVCADA